MKTHFGELLYDKIRKSGKTIPEFSLKVGIHKSILSKISEGGIAPKWERVLILVRYLELTGKERQRFLDLAAIAHLPPDVRDRFVRILDAFELIDTRLDSSESRINKLEP
jgi:hypothetical protein